MAGRNLQPVFARGTVPITTVGFSPDGRLILTAAADKQVSLWDHTTHRLLRSFEGGTRALFSPDGTMILAGSSDGVQLWDTVTGERLRSFAEKPRDLSALSFAPDGTWAVGTDHAGRVVYLWNVTTGRLLNRVATPLNVNHAVVSPDGRFIAGGSFRGFTFLWPVLP